MSVIAQTDRFTIRNFTPDEEAAFMSLFDDKIVIEHLPKRTREQHLKIFRGFFDGYASGSHLGSWGLFNNLDGDLIGMCLLRKYNDEVGKIEVGYVFHQKYWGKGIASEMARILVDHAFKHPDTEQVVAVTTLTNTASQNVLQKVGLVRQADFVKDDEELAFFVLKK
jgi:ribosomal-protein-alanine N-acetyltransferase